MENPIGIHGSHFMAQIVQCIQTAVIKQATLLKLRSNTTGMVAWEAATSVWWSIPSKRLKSKIKVVKQTSLDMMAQSLKDSQIL